MVNRRSNLRRKKPNKRVNSSLTRLRSGIPTTQRRVPSDPRTLPISFDWAVVVRYICTSVTTTGSAVVSSTSPDAFPRILVGAESTPKPRISVPLTFRRIVADAFMRHYGYAFPLTSDYNTTNSLFALGKVTFYGPLGNHDHIVLQVHYGTETSNPVVPGFVGQDSGNRLRRAHISCTPSRLLWDLPSLSASADSTVMVVPSWDNFSPSGTDYGTIDITVHIRRSAKLPPTSSFTNVTYIEDGTIPDNILRGMVHK